MAKKDCPFCGNDRIVKENALAKVLLSNPRKVPGHILVIPKRHVEKPWLLTNDALLAIFELIFFIEKRLMGKLGAGMDIRQNYRPFMQQSRLKVDHVHFQIIPRYDKDYIYKVSEIYETDIFADLDDLERAEVSKLLK